MVCCLPILVEAFGTHYLSLYYGIHCWKQQGSWLQWGSFYTVSVTGILSVVGESRSLKWQRFMKADIFDMLLLFFIT